MDGIEDLTPPCSPDSWQGRDSDTDLDEDDGQSPDEKVSVQRPYIAHKGMHNFNMDDEDNTAKVVAPTFEEISDEEDNGWDNPVDTTATTSTRPIDFETNITEIGDNLETRTLEISNIQGSTSAEFEDISDAEQEEDGKFSPEPDEDESVNDPVSPEEDFESDDNDDGIENIIDSIDNINDDFRLGDDIKDKNINEPDGDEIENHDYKMNIDKDFKRDVGENLPKEYDDDLDAPVPSPFSDIGEMSGPENAIISDILNSNTSDISLHDFSEDNLHESVAVESLSPLLDLEDSYIDGTPQVYIQNSSLSSSSEHIQETTEETIQAAVVEVEDDGCTPQVDNQHSNSLSASPEHIQESTQETVQETAQETTEESTKEITHKTVKDITQETIHETTQETIQETTQETIQETTQDIIQKTIQETTQDVPAEVEDENKMDQGEELQEDVGGLIADIFGDSDEEEEFEGFGKEELYPEKKKARPIISDDDSDDEDEHEVPKRVEEQPVLDIPAPQEESSDDERPVNRDRGDMVSDFDLMMQKKKEINRNKRRARKDGDIINDNDDIIAAMIKQMKDAAQQDRLLNQAGQAATKKMKLLPSVVMHLIKADLQHTFIDCNILPIMKDWLTPLPDNSLPHIHIRDRFLKILEDFPPLEKSALKMSGIGRAVMLLYKHPKESRGNRKTAGRIIASWARPIFGVATKFTDLSREEREDREKMNIQNTKKRKLSSTTENDTGNSGSMHDALSDGKKAQRPGDKGFIARARVPMPSNKDYVVRPQSSFDAETFFAGKQAKKALTRFEKQSKKYNERINRGKIGGRAVPISLNGSKLQL